MPNEHVLARLTGIQNILMAVHQAGMPMSAATKGREREAFIDDFLTNVMPAPFRFGSGDATDATGQISGQLDVVVEYPFMPSLPVIGGTRTRLYLAESVAAVVEVKSDVASQWDEAVATARKLAALRRSFGAQMIMGHPPGERIPLFVAGYTGWKQVETVAERLRDGPIHGILVIDGSIFVSSAEFRGITATGPWALWGLICCLHEATSTLKSASPQPLDYAR